MCLFTRLGLRYTVRIQTWNPCFIQRVVVLGSIVLNIFVWHNTVRPEKTEPWNNGMLRASVGVYDYYHNYIHVVHEVWLICFRMIHCWNSSSHASLSSIVFNVAQLRLSLMELRNNKVLFRYVLITIFIIHRHCQDVPHSSSLFDQNGLISPWATFTIFMSDLPTSKWYTWILTFNLKNNAAQWCMTGGISRICHSKA